MYHSSCLFMKIRLQQNMNHPGKRVRSGLEKWILILPVFLWMQTIACGQGKNMILIAGASIPDLFHAGIGFCVDRNVVLNVKLGNGFQREFGFFRNYTVGSDVSIYFGKESEKYKAKKWAVNSGLTFLKSESAAAVWRYLYFDNSLSYDLFLTGNVIFQPEVGVAFQLFKDRYSKPDYKPGWFGSLDINMPVIPVLGGRFRFIL